MNQIKVLHLVSNSLTHPENSANSFKVSYNAPFDLRRRKITLVDVTLTKAQDNVLQENITFTKSYKINKQTSSYNDEEIQSSITFDYPSKH